MIWNVGMLPKTIKILIPLFYNDQLWWVQTEIYKTESLCVAGGRLWTSKAHSVRNWDSWDCRDIWVHATNHY
jgi:hypothetical protein